jgi:hypothetical protein
MDSDKPQTWKSYEDAVRAIISQHREFFGLEFIEPTSGKVEGKSGYSWNIEIIGYTSDNRKIVLFEVRRKTTRNIEPKEAGELAYRIEDTGAEKGYFVTPLETRLSSGAYKIANSEEIEHIQVSINSTPDNHLMRYLNNTFLKIAEQLGLKEAWTLTKFDKDGKIISKSQF